MTVHGSSYPTAAALRVRTHPSGAWTIVEVRGEMDVQAGPLVRDVLDDEAACVVFDLHAVTFLDASGLGVLIERRRRAVEVGGRVRLVAPTTQVLRILALTRTAHLFLTLDTVDAAVSAPLHADPATSA